MRHGEAGHASQDAMRALTDAGRQEVETAVQAVTERFKLGSSAHLISSPYERARQTAAIWHRELGLRGEVEVDENTTPEGNAIRFSRRMKEQSNTWILCSHFPFVPELASFLLTGRKDGIYMTIHTGCALLLEPTGELGAPGSYRLSAQI